MAKTKTQTPVRRVRFVYDEDAHFEECNGEARPLTSDEYADNEYMHEGQPIPYEEYLRYYGNPDRHVYLRTEVEEQCPCCKAWTTVGGTGWIDLMDDDPGLSYVDRWLTEGELASVPGYLREIAVEDIREDRA